MYDPDQPARTWFAQYAQRFDTVELNATFYRLPTAAAVDQWRAQAPDGFCYAAKVGQFGTHRRKLRDPGSWMPRHLERITRLGDHLGPNLFQLPPRWHRDVARLDDALAACDPRLRWAVEVRDATWLHDDVFEVLARHRAALCIHDLLADHPRVRTTDWTYVRFHGPRPIAEPYHGRYGSRRLSPFVDLLGGWADDGCDVFAYFNNDWHGHAVADATWLRDHLQRPAERRGDQVRSAGWNPGAAGTRDGSPSPKEADMPGKSSHVKNEKQYEALKDKGMSKSRAARIANSPDSSNHGGEKSHKGGGSAKQGGTHAQHVAAGRKGGKAAASKR